MGRKNNTLVPLITHETLEKAKRWCSKIYFDKVLVGSLGMRPIKRGQNCRQGVNAKNQLWRSQEQHGSSFTGRC
jgi:hypothetical protein